MEDKPRGPSGYYTTDPISELPIVDDLPIGPAVLETIEPTDEFLKVQLQSSAREKLAFTDWMVIRAMETGEVLPKEWQNYRKKLRDIIKGKEKTLPLEPKKV